MGAGIGRAGSAGAGNECRGTWSTRSKYFHWRKEDNTPLTLIFVNVEVFGVVLVLGAADPGGWWPVRRHGRGRLVRLGVHLRL